MSDAEKRTEELADEQRANKSQLLFALDGVRYEALRELERRGEGEVLILAQRCLQQGPAGCVAVRTLRSPSQFVHRHRLVDEVRLAFLLHHPAIAQIHHLTIHRGVPHVIMEHVDGPSLDTLLKIAAMSERPVSVPFTLYVASEVADGLHHAHSLKDEDGISLGIIHRDVSPRNISLDRHGAVKVTHFGAACSLLVGREETPHLLLEGDVAYASPEYLRRQHLTPASDVFSLGLVLVKMLTGRHLFDMEGTGVARPLLQRPGERVLEPEEPSSLPLERMRSLIERYGPEDVEERVKDLPESLKAILHRALRREPEERYSTAAELGDALRALLAEAPWPYGRKEVSAEISQLLSAASALRERAELPREGALPERYRS